VKHWTEQPDGTWTRDVDGRSLRINEEFEAGGIRWRALIVGAHTGLLQDLDSPPWRVTPEQAAALVADVLGLEE
jgi:hypothetical protein